MINLLSQGQVPEKMKIKLIQLEILCLLFPIFNATASVLYVDSNSPDPVSPYANWETAATNIQDAIEAAVAGDTVIVTNGIYATGGKSMGGANTNRVAVDKAIIVQSVNGPGVTIIQGAWDPISTNGLNAVRCA